jgi:hypothetical protein
LLCLSQVLTPLQEGQLEASSYPWCSDVWAITRHAAEVAAATGACSDDSGNSGSAGRKGRKQQQEQQQQQEAAAAAAANDEDPLAALAMGQDVLQPLMPFMTAFQLLRAPVTARGAGLRLKRELALDYMICSTQPEWNPIQESNRRLIGACSVVYSVVLSLLLLQQLPTCKR